MKQDQQSEMATLSQNQSPVVGMKVEIRGVQCRIVRIHPFGTINVESIYGGRAWRVSGLMFEQEAAK